MEDLYHLSPDQLERRLIDKVGDGTWPPVHKAVAVARDKHRGQQRKDGSDFVGHPLRTALLLLEVAGVQDPNMLCAAVLHDVVEDTDASCDDLLEEFGSKVADLVRILTLEPYQDGQDKSARDVAHFQHLAWEGRDPQLLRTADRLDNIRSLGDTVPPARREAYLRDTRDHLLPLTLASNTALYHALNLALADQGCP
ncbi:MAG: HD domain-containing protein [Planctomycetes bacterium]|nr:HD domain-containing protein [Planctomycetota bacterium]MBL7009188.1 HD domain-containing protein [Planctomycetota bacterium]